ncbi:MAG: Fe-S biogenesis protein NfuA [Methylococcales bacterium]|jgi:Fe/S biogenesis protein NfuA|nr:Fe-S biogenesis protein NfuA [Methylococcales bacterium]MBT7409226.1 Fe-S biogenesis protein NfuA [Methylococcales bacterium]
MITMTDTAKTYLSDMLTAQDIDDIALRIFVKDPGKQTAQVEFAFCGPEGENKTDVNVSFNEFEVFLDRTALPYLKDIEVEYVKDKMGGKIQVIAPHINAPILDENSSIEDRIRHILNSEVNPGLASHGGAIDLVQVENGDTAVMKFGGGCQGCGMANVTMKQGVEKSILEKIPEIKRVVDVTDHSQGTNAYYK